MTPPLQGTRLRAIYDRLLNQQQWHDLSDLAPANCMSSIIEQLSKKGMKVISRPKIEDVGTKSQIKKEYMCINDD